MSRWENYPSLRALGFFLGGGGWGRGHCPVGSSREAHPPLTHPWPLQQDYGALRAERSLGARVAELNVTLAVLRSQLRSSLSGLEDRLEEGLETQVGREWGAYQ